MHLRVSMLRVSEHICMSGRRCLCQHNFALPQAVGGTRRSRTEASSRSRCMPLIALKWCALPPQ